MFLYARKSKWKVLNIINEKNPCALDYWGVGLDHFTHTSFPKRNQVELLFNTQQLSLKKS